MVCSGTDQNCHWEHSHQEAVSYRDWNEKWNLRNGVGSVRLAKTLNIFAQSKTCDCTHLIRLRKRNGQSEDWREYFLLWIVSQLNAHNGLRASIVLPGHPNGGDAVSP